MTFNSVCSSRFSEFVNRRDRYFVIVSVRRSSVDSSRVLRAMVIMRICGCDYYVMVSLGYDFDLTLTSQQSHNIVLMTKYGEERFLAYVNPLTHLRWRSSFLLKPDKNFLQ